MSVFGHLPDPAFVAAYEQGWDEESLIIHLCGFIASIGQEGALADYFATVAAEENEETAP